MKLSFNCSVVALLLLAPLAVAQDVCEICGCSFCPPGFMMQNPSGLITITQEILDEFGGIIVPGPDGDATLETVLAGFGFVAGSVLPCSLLDSAALSGLIPIEACIDLLRLNSIVRDTCGCPALPDPPTNAPTIAPVVAPTLAPVPDPTEAPVVAPTPAPVPDPTEAPVIATTPAPVPGPTEVTTSAPVVTPTNAPVVASADAPTDAPITSPVASPATNSPVMPPPTPVATPEALPVAMPSPVVVPTPVDKGDSPRHYIDEIYYLTHAISSSYSVNATELGSPWATVTDVTDKVGTAGFMHEYCTRTSPEFWYCAGTYVDLYYAIKGRNRRQFHGNVSFEGWFSDNSMEGMFTITGGTDDFRGAKGHVSVCHEGGMSQRELHVWY